MPAAAIAPNALVVRIFAREDGGLVEAHPVKLDAAAVTQLVPAFAREPGEIHAIELAVAEKLAGVTLSEFSEPVDAFLEPEVPVVGPADE